MSYTSYTDFFKRATRTMGQPAGLNPFPYQCRLAEEPWPELMGPGLKTSAQLEAFRQKIGLSSRSRSLWVSATLKRGWLSTVDFDPASTIPLELSEEEKKAPAVRERREAVKVVTRCDVALTSTKPSKSEKAEESEKIDKLTSDDIKTYLKVLADRVLATHQQGTTTLAVLNAVERAQGLFVELKDRLAESVDTGPTQGSADFRTGDPQTRTGSRGPRQTTVRLQNAAAHLALRASMYARNSAFICV